MKEGWKYTTIGESCNINYGTRVVRSRDGGTIYDVYGGGGATFKMDIYNRENCLVVARFAMSKQCTRYVKGKFFLNDSGLTVSPKDSSNLSQTLLDKILLALNDTIYSFGRGSAQRNLNMKEFSAMKIAYPIDSAEQEKFVSFLDAEFAKIDAIKANAEKQLRDAKALFQSALKDLLTPKEGWSESTIKDLCDVTKNIKWDESCGVRKYIDLTSVSRDSLSIHSPIEINFESAPSRAKQIVQTNDILFATTRPTLRRVCIVPEELNNNICSTGFCVLRSKSNLYHNFLFYNLLSDDFYQYIEPLQTGASYPAVTDKIVKGYKILIPNYEDQKEIAEQLDKISSKIKSLQQNYEQTITLCNDLKQSILKDIFG